MTNPRVSECNICPQWVMRCVHFDDVTLTLVDITEYTGAVNCVCEHDNDTTWSYCIVRARGAGEPCDCGAVLEWDEEDAEVLLTTDSKDEALAAFREAERELLAVNYG